MNEIEKLYKNVGIPKCGKRQCKDIEYLECQNYCFCNMDNKCDKFIFEYPPFTAEKQLELIIFIINKFGTLTFFDYEEFTREVMAEKLAKLLNNRWQDLSEEVKQQVREILE